MTGAPALDVHGWSKFFKVNVRTIQRDLNYLRQQLGFSVIFDRKTAGYRYQDPEAVRSCVENCVQPLDFEFSSKMIEHLDQPKPSFIVKMTLDPDLLQELERASFHQGLALEDQVVILRCTNPQCLIDWVLTHPSSELQAPQSLVKDVCHQALGVFRRHLRTLHSFREQKHENGAKRQHLSQGSFR